MTLYAIKRADGMWYVGTADSQPIFGQESGRARFSADAAEQRLRGLQAKGHNCEKVPVR